MNDDLVTQLDVLAAAASLSPMPSRLNEFADALVAAYPQLRAERDAHRVLVAAAEKVCRAFARHDADQPESDGWVLAWCALDAWREVAP